MLFMSEKRLVRETSCVEETSGNPIRPLSKQHVSHETLTRSDQSNVKPTSKWQQIILIIIIIIIIIIYLV